MLNNRTLLVLLLLAAGVVSATAQKSAYGRFGYGELAAPAFSAGKAMGGVGYGIRDSKSINPLNPASYSSVDSLSFLFDIGAYINTAWYEDGVNRATTFEGNIDYLGLQFRLFKGMGLSVGMVPFSNVSYSWSQPVGGDGVAGTEKYTGTGGINRLYLGLGYNLFKNFSLGANASYFFGKTDYETTQSLGGGASGNYSLQRLRISSMLVDLGVQYTIPLKANHEITLGASYTPKMKLNGSYHNLHQIGSMPPHKDTTITSLGFDYPQSIGGGISYAKKRKYMIAADVLYQQWDDARFFDGEPGEDWNGSGSVLQDRYRFALGGQYIPNATGRGYLGKIRYRMGTHYSNSYFKIREDGMDPAGTKEFGLSAGFGFPLLDNRSSLNLTFDYISVLPDRKDFVKEQYFRISISYTMNEMWFIKRKID